MWGLLHGAFLAFERAGFGRMLERLPPLLGHFYTLLVAMNAWVFFRADDLAHSLAYLRAMYGMGEGDGLVLDPIRYLTPEVTGLLFVGAILSMPVYPWLRRRFGKPLKERNAALALASTLPFLVLFALSSASIASGSYNPFIYFRF